MMNNTEAVERVQLGVRMEKRMVQVLKGLAEFNDETLGQLLEKIVLHSFEPMPTTITGSISFPSIIIRAVSTTVPKPPFASRA